MWRCHSVNLYILVTCTHLCVLSFHDFAPLVCTSVSNKGTYQNSERRPESQAVSGDMCSTLCKRKKRIFRKIVYELQLTCQRVPEGSWLYYHHLAVGPQRKWTDKAAAVLQYRKSYMTSQQILLSRKMSSFFFCNSWFQWICWLWTRNLAICMFGECSHMWPIQNVSLSPGCCDGDTDWRPDSSLRPPKEPWIVNHTQYTVYLDIAHFIRWLLWS